MSTALVFPVLWKGDSTPSIQGTLCIEALDLPLRAIEGSTVKDLIMALNQRFRLERAAGAFHAREVKEILLYGTRLRYGRSLASVIMELSTYCPRLVATTRSRRSSFPMMRIYVMPPSGPPLRLDCVDDDTIDDIKLKIQDRTSIPEDKQYLTFAGKALEGNRTVAEYSMYSSCTLSLALRLRGGFSPGKRFADLSDDSLRSVREFDASAPVWRVVDKGLNLEGVCKNPSCNAYGEWVIHPNGFNAFNLVRDGDISCPMCAGAVTPLTCLLYDCVWKYEGVRSGDSTLISSPWKGALGRKYHRFDVDGLHGIVGWTGLLIVVEVPGASRLAMLATGGEAPTIAKDAVCSVCWSPSIRNAKLAKTLCGHGFHRACVSEWAGWCKRGRVLFTCPVCRKDLSTDPMAA